MRDLRAIITAESVANERFKGYLSPLRVWSMRDLRAIITAESVVNERFKGYHHC